MSGYSLPSTSWIPRLDGFELEVPHSVLDMAGIFPSSSAESDCGWSRDSLLPLLELVPEYQEELWEAILWVWRLKVLKDEDRDCSLWPSLIRAWMVQSQASSILNPADESQLRFQEICLKAGIGQFSVVVEYAHELECCGLFPANSLLQQPTLQPLTPPPPPLVQRFKTPKTEEVLSIPNAMHSPDQVSVQPPITGAHMIAEGEIDESVGDEMEWEEDTTGVDTTCSSSSGDEGSMEEELEDPTMRGIPRTNSLIPDITVLTQEDSTCDTSEEDEIQSLLHRGSTRKRTLPDFDVEEPATIPETVPSPVAIINDGNTTQSANMLPWVDLGNESFLEGDVIKSESVPAAEGAICERCKESGKTTCQPAWHLHYSNVQVRCKSCKLAGGPCSFSLSKLQITVPPTIERSATEERKRYFNNAAKHASNMRRDPSYLKKSPACQVFIDQGAIEILSDGKVQVTGRSTQFPESPGSPGPSTQVNLAMTTLSSRKVVTRKGRKVRKVATQSVKGKEKELEPSSDEEVVVPRRKRARRAGIVTKGKAKKLKFSNDGEDISTSLNDAAPAMKINHTVHQEIVEFSNLAKYFELITNPSATIVELTTMKETLEALHAYEANRLSTIQTMFESHKDDIQLLLDWASQKIELTEGDGQAESALGENQF